MGDKLGIDEIITMENGKAEIKKQEPKLKERLQKAKAKAVKKKAAKTKAVKRIAEEPPEEEIQDKNDIRKKDVSEIIKDAKPPSKDNILSVIEAALFMSNRPLMLDELARISGINSLGYLKQLLDRLQKDYGTRGMEIVNTRSGWDMQVRQHLMQHVAHLTPYSDIPEGCKRTLALIVYKEPMKQADLIRIQGNKAYTYIKELKRKGLVKTEKKGRTIVVRLTLEFERYFGDERQKIKGAMVKEFGDPAKMFPEPNKPTAEDKQQQLEQAKLQQAEQTIKQVKEE